jgi:thioredoxin-dependent peroxiredoxin
MAKIRVGDRAPDFSGTTQDGSVIRLSDVLKERAVVLFFYPKDGTAICTKEACSFRDSYRQFVDAGAEVIGVSSDSTEAHRDFAHQHGLPFHLISDEGGSLRKAFGVPRTLGLFPGRVTYVIDRTGIVRLIFSAQFATEDHVRQALRAVVAGV